MCGPLGYLRNLLGGDAGVVKSRLQPFFGFILSWWKAVTEEKHGRLSS